MRDALRRQGRPARIEAAWVRPQGALLRALLCAAGVGASLLALSAPATAAVVLAIVLALFAAEASGRVSPARLVFPRRATQNVVSEPVVVPPGARVRLIVTAGLDAAPTGVAFLLAPLEARIRRALGGWLPSPAGVLAASLLLLCILAFARAGGGDGDWIGPLSVPPAIALVVGFFAYADIAFAAPSPGANADGSALAAALAIVAALDRRPPRHLAVECVAAGASHAGQLGLRAYIDARRAGARPEEIAVIALGPCGAGGPVHHRTEGLIIGARMHPQLIGDAHEVGLPGVRRGVTGALAARLAGWPQLGVSARDDRGLAGRAYTAEDTPEAVDRQAVAATVERCLALVGRLDGQLAQDH